MGDYFDEARKRAIESGREVLDHLYRRLLWTAPFKLGDGTPVTIRGFIEPQINDQGELVCGIDALLGDEGHLELIMKQGGWGRAINVERAKSKSPRGR